jgi:hypothetical protein
MPQFSGDIGCLINPIGKLPLPDSRKEFTLALQRLFSVFWDKKGAVPQPVKKTSTLHFFFRYEMEPHKSATVEVSSCLR